MDMSTTDRPNLPGSLDVPGLVFRYFSGDGDWPGLAASYNRGHMADGLDDVQTAETLAQRYKGLPNFDPYKDLLVAELDGNIAGFVRTSWIDELATGRIYWFIAILDPGARGKGIEQAMLNWAESHLREINAQLPAPPTGEQRLFSTRSYSTQKDYEDLLKRESYEPVRFGYDMVRPLDEPIPEAPVPEGLEVRPARPEDYKSVWAASEEAFRGHWGYVEPREGDFERWAQSHLFQPHLWQVGWDGDRAAGSVLNYVDENYNETFGKRRGYTEDITVGRDWRRRGLARALIARSMRMFKDMGMNEVALGVDTQNPTGALQLYESLGYRVTHQGATWRKSL